MDAKVLKGRLEQARIDNDRPSWSVTACGKLLTVKRHRYRQKLTQDVVRGPITHFSRRARAARLRRIAQVDWHAAGRGSFVTLTYPDNQADHTMEMRKSHRYLVNRHICRCAGKHLACFWRVEWMPRLSGIHVGTLMPHMHLLYLGDTKISVVELEAVWRRIIGATQKVQVDVREVSVGDMVACYASKYCSKEASSSYLDNVPKRNRTGRHAGELRSNLIPFHPKEVTERIDDAITRWLRQRACETLWWYDPRFDEGFTILGDTALEIIREFGEKKLDSLRNKD